MADRLMLDVVIPARGEERTLPTTLDAIFGQANRLVLHVVIVLNGSDRDVIAHAIGDYITLFQTAGHKLEIIECELASKPAALNAGDAARGGGSVIYMDADAVLLPGTLLKLATLLVVPQPRLVGPTLRFGRPSRAVERSFLICWRHLPAVRDDVIGAGCYGVNPPGRARWGVFPDVSADDAFVRGQFRLNEREVATGGGMLIQFPTGRSLLRMLKRWREANRALAIRGCVAPSSGLIRNLAAILVLPRLWRHLPGFLFVRLASRMVQIERNTVGSWQPDRRQHGQKRH